MKLRMFEQRGPHFDNLTSHEKSGLLMSYLHVSQNFRTDGSTIINI